MGMRMAPPWPAARWETEPAQRSLSPEECELEGWRGVRDAEPSTKPGSGCWYRTVHPHISQGPVPQSRVGSDIQIHSLGQGQWGGDVPTLLHQLQGGSAAHPGPLLGLWQVMGALPPCCQGDTTSVSSSCAREMLLFLSGFLGWEQVWAGSAHPDPCGRVGPSTEGPCPGFRACQH